MQYRDEIYQLAEPEVELPFDEAEYASRRLRVRQAMTEAGIDCLFIYSIVGRKSRCC